MLGCQEGELLEAPCWLHRWAGLEVPGAGPLCLADRGEVEGQTRLGSCGGEKKTLSTTKQLI